MSKILINIAWPYANGPIHLGHVAGSLLPPDIFRRYNVLLGNEVWMVGGSDQHGTPITVSAEKEGVTPEVIAERYHQINKKAIEGLGIEYTLFNKTHCDTHFEVTQKMFSRMRRNGYIYDMDEDEYYCPQCAKFLPDRYVEGICPKCGAQDVRSDQCDACGATFVPGDVIKPHCTRCGSTPEVRASKQFALKLSAFEKPLLDILAKNTHWRPNVRSFTENFLRGGLRDRSITRDMSWGVPIPEDGDEWKSKVIYVWFDAVIGYMSSTIEHSRQIGKPDYWKTFWQNPECRHYYFIGKDNIPFHSIIWPAMLMAADAGFNQPYDIPANEYLMFNGGKLSKSRKGNVDGNSVASKVGSMIPRDIPHVLEKFDPEEIRYYLSVVMPDLHDTDFTWEDLEIKINNELVAALGNFYHRCLSFTHKNYGTIPEADVSDPKVEEEIRKAFDDYTAHLSGCDFKKAIQDVMALAHFGNEYFNSCTPWKLVKEDKLACGRVLNDNLRIVKALSIMAWPFMPASSQRIWGFMGLPGTIESAGYGALLEPLPAGTVMNEPVPVYGKIVLKEMFADLYAQAEAEAEAEKKAKKDKKAKKEEPAAPAGPSEPFDAFRMLDLRVGQVMEAEDHPNADKLFKLTVDIGEGKPRTICAGLKAFYTRDEMVGRKAIVVSNLAPRPLRGVDSCGMLLAADDEALGGSTVALLKPSADVPVGTRFNCGFENNTGEIDYKKHFSAVTMKVTSQKAGIEGADGAPEFIATVCDAGKVIALTDGKGTFATVERKLTDGAGVR